jgi:hypothetical protein
VALARAAADPTVAAGYFEQACAASDAGACAEAGDRFLRAETRDPARAIAALQRGCAGGGAAACARMARVYEEGDGALPNLALAAETREKACTAGDGASCRKLACDVPSALPRAAELWQRGCQDGDAISCALAKLSANPGGAAVRGQVAEANPAARSASTAPSTTTVATAKGTVPEAAEPARSHRSAGYTVLGVATLAAGGALIFSLSGQDEGPRYWGRNRLSEGEQHSSGMRGLSMVLGAAAVVSAGTGIGLLLSRPDDPSKLTVGVAPSGVVLSGALP